MAKNPSLKAFEKFRAKKNVFNFPADHPPVTLTGSLVPDDPWGDIKKKKPKKDK